MLYLASLFKLDGFSPKQKALTAHSDCRHNDIEGSAIILAILSSRAGCTRRTRKPEPVMDKVNLSEKLAQFSDQRKPKIVGDLKRI